MQASSQTFTFKREIINPAEWHDVSTEAPIPLQQHPTYGRALARFGAGAEQVTVLQGDAIVARALLVSRTFFKFIKFTTLSRGPVWCADGLSDADKLNIYKGIHSLFLRWKWDFLSVMPEAEHSANTHKAFKKLGFIKTMTGYSTAWLDLRPSENELRASLKGKWRNQLSSAEKAKLTVSFGGKKPHSYAWLLEKEREQRDSKNYHATPVGFVPNFVASCTPKSASKILSVTAMSGRQKIAGGIFLLHGNSATYHIGWAGEEGRKQNAQNLVIWQAIVALKKEGINFLDLGGLNTVDASGIARFKLGTGATPITLVGNYI